ncbi:hypothetical protein DL768_011471 [Monosporascus sp. mg162]|nr:hypothetical protein DL768_011471 [Monosporascus sp. mg162]
MPIKKENRPVFERRRKEYGIIFTDALPAEKWPADHREVFESIEKVKQFRYSTYAAAQDSGDDFDTTPWKAEAKSQARRLTEKAKDCLSRNEATWRLACSAKRIAIAVVVLVEHDRRTNRADDKVIHPPDLAQKLPQEQKPDRIYGLRQTRNFEDMLLKEIGNGRFPEDHLHRQPHSTTEGEALLFPFLVVESKAGNAPDDWSSIRLQTAFPIYTYLNVQQSLSRDDALQLFLIVDYMSDWARDVYRPALLTELRTLASADADVATVFTDTDIFSSGDILPALDLAETVIETQPSNHGVQAAFRSLDSRLGAVRHITPIESRFLSIFITADNIQTFLRSMNETVRRIFVRQILDQFYSATPGLSMLSVDQLNAMEELWTGQSRRSGPFNLKETNFYTAHLIAYYMSASWEQVRELCTISIAEDAFDTLIAESKLKVGRGKAKKPAVVMEKAFVDSNLMCYLSQLRTASAQWNLLASISRVAHYIDSTISPSSGRCWFKPSHALTWELVNATYKFHKKGDLGPELPFLHISKSHEIQTMNSNAQGTTNFDDQSTVDSDHQDTFQPLNGDLRVSAEGAILIYGEQSHPIYGRSPSSLCVYIVHGSVELPSEDDLARIIENAFADCHVYETIRDNRTLNLRTLKKNRKIWNLGNPYGALFSYEDGDYRWTDDEYSDNEQYGFIPGLCNGCQEDLDISSDLGWPSWMKRVLRKALMKAISRFSATNAPESGFQNEYNINTPEPSSPNTMIGRFEKSSSGFESSSATSDLITGSSDSSVDESVDGDVQSLLSSGSPRSQDSSKREDIDDNSFAWHGNQSLETSAEGNTVRRKRKRRQTDED